MQGSLGMCWLGRGSERVCNRAAEVAHLNDRFTGSSVDGVYSVNYEGKHYLGVRWDGSMSIS